MKYLYIDNDRIVREIIPALDERFPGIPITERYAEDFLNQCLEVADDLHVESGMEYLPLKNKFVYPIRFVGSSQISVKPIEDAEIYIAWKDSKGAAVSGSWTVESSELDIAAAENSISVQAVPEGRYQIAVTFVTDDGREEKQTIVIAAQEESAAPPEEPENTPTPSELDKLTAKIDTLTQTNQMLEDCLVEMAGVVYQ